MAVLACALPAYGQYPGRITPSSSSNGPHLRATAVLEYTGTLGHIQASRLVPVAIWDGLEYEPGGLYLADPAPLAVLTGTQYELESDGRSRGFYNIGDSEQLAGLWIGAGRYQAPPVEARLRRMKNLPQIVGGTNGPDQPHFAHVPRGDRQTASAAPPSATPTLHQRPADSDSDTSSSDASISGNGVQIASQTEPDFDQPILHRRGAAASQQTANLLPIDPNRPRLSYANPDATQQGPAVLLGMPADMHQIAGVSDSRTLDTESYAFIWSNPGDAAKMQAELEQIAEQALTPPAPTPAPPAHSTHRRKPQPPPAPPALADVYFRAFSLTFGGGATLVLSARTDTSPVQYVTIIAQPDFYGNPQILLKQVTTGNDLDALPRMRLIDAVDTTGDGRGDLIFELRGYTYRQFAIYSIYNGTASRVFVTEPIATPQAIVNPSSLS
jgi:hypothetical protein